MKKTVTILLLFINFFTFTLRSQVRISLMSGASVQRSFKKNQRYWAFGQEVCVDWQLTTKGGMYASVNYYANGKFKNQLSALAKSANTIPRQIFFTNSAQVRLIQISLGFKHYFVGTNDAETNWNLYTITGFGLVFGSATNTYSATVDTAAYYMPQQPVAGSGHFKRLTLDLGAGWEIPVGSDMFLFAEGKIWIPTTDYPSKYLFVNEHAPLAGMITAGLRILF